MKRNLRQSLWIIIFALCSSSSHQIAAQTQNPRPPEANRGDITHMVQLQFLVASNSANPKTRTDYPASLEAVIKQLKPPFKKHYLVATYLYNVADSSGLDVHDVTYAQFEEGGGLHPMFFDFRIAGIQLNTNDSVHVPRFIFEARQRMALGNTPPLSDTVTTGMNTALNLRYGVPTIVGTITNGLSEAELVLVITVNHLSAR